MVMVRVCDMLSILLHFRPGQALSSHKKNGAKRHLIFFFMFHFFLLFVSNWSHPFQSRILFNTLFLRNNQNTFSIIE